MKDYSINKTIYYLFNIIIQFIVIFLPSKFFDSWLNIDFVLLFTLCLNVIYFNYCCSHYCLFEGGDIRETPHKGFIIDIATIIPSVVYYAVLIFAHKIKLSLLLFVLMINVLVLLNGIIIRKTKPLRINGMRMVVLTHLISSFFICYDILFVGNFIFINIFTASDVVQQVCIAIIALSTDFIICRVRMKKRGLLQKETRLYHLAGIPHVIPIIICITIILNEVNNRGREYNEHVAFSIVSAIAIIACLIMERILLIAVKMKGDLRNGKRTI